MKVIKLFIASMLLLSSFQTFAAFLITTPDVVSTPENTDKVIRLTVNKNGFNELAFGDRKFTMSGKDVNKLLHQKNSFSLNVLAYFQNKRNYCSI
jgi:hypothetical protein